MDWVGKGRDGCRLRGRGRDQEGDGGVLGGRCSRRGGGGILRKVGHQLRLIGMYRIG